MLTAEPQAAPAPTNEDILIAIEDALEKNLLPTPGIAVLERTRDAMLAALGPLIEQLRHAPADRAALYDAEADDIEARCDDHSPKGSTGNVWGNCHCAVAHHLRRKAAAARNAA
jgi:hypothetical protein